MPEHKANLLVVDDDAAIRKLLSIILAQCGYEVRSAEDGFSALAEIRESCPDVILSDLNMPGMSGFEFLSLIRRRCPEVHVIAMSSAFSGCGVPAGVAADAFYKKGTDIQVLLHTLKVMTQEDRPLPFRHSSVPIWIPTNGHDRSGEPYVMIACPECQRTFKQVPDEAGPLIQQAVCIHCEGSIRYAVVPFVISAETMLVAAVA